MAETNGDGGGGPILSSLSGLIMMKFPWRKREKGWTCTRVQQYWDEYIEDQLSVQDKFEYEGHLAKCEKCQDFIRFLKYKNPAIAGAVRAAIRAQPVPPIPQKIIDLAERLSPEDKLRLIQFAQRSEEEEKLREGREMKREKAERAKPN